MNFVVWMNSRYGYAFRDVEDINNEFAPRLLQFEHDKFSALNA